MFQEIKKLIKSKNKNILNYNCGLERECLRLTEKGKLSSKAHPKVFGCKLTHPHLTTDFAEMQLELSTPPLPSFTSTINYLSSLMRFTQKQLPGEIFWPFSMPPKLQSPSSSWIAIFEESESGLKKSLYRKNLADRYGINMQMISGFHFNFSFPGELFYILKKKSKQPEKQVRSDVYLHITRNALRYSPLMIYLMGASNVYDKSFRSMKEGKSKGAHAHIPYASSIRMSEYGYQSELQQQFPISFNRLNDYVRDMNRAMSTPMNEYRDLQNPYLLQIENELYSLVRPKITPFDCLKPIDCMLDRGIEYLEFRFIDLNPFVYEGISLDQLYFLHLFILYCASNPSPSLSHKEQETIFSNQNTVALFARKKDLKIVDKAQKTSFQGWANRILDGMDMIADALGSKYRKSLTQMKEMIKDPRNALSAKLEGLTNYEQIGLTLAKKYRAKAIKHPISNGFSQKFHKEIKQSIEDFKELKQIESLELSTKLLIKKAKKRSIHVEILDPINSVIRLSKNGRKQIVQQATKTSKDTYIAPLIMENKHLCKTLLKEKRLNAPEGGCFYSIETAIAYLKEKKGLFVIKPNDTNYGVGIHFVNANDELKALDALKVCFSLSNTVIVEQEVKGEEIRFLIIDGKCIACTKRDPANVIGNGIDSIETLFYRKKAYEIDLEMKQYLHEQGYKTDTIVPKNKKIYLRKNSNVSTGGDAIDYSDSVHASYKKIAIQACKAIQVNICGVDMMITNIKEPASSKNYAIIELNFNPVLYFHENPDIGKSHPVTDHLLDFLGF